MLLNSFSIRLYKKLYERRVILIYVPLLLYWLILFIATTIPTDSIPQFFNAQDKAEHFIAYCILGILLYFAFVFQKKYPSWYRRPILYSLLVIGIYAAVDELHQLLIPGRYCDFLDWTADVIGGIIGIGFAYLIVKMGKANLESA